MASPKNAYFLQQKATKAQFLPRIFSSSVLGYIIFIDVNGPKGPNFCSRSFSLRFGLIDAMKTFVEFGSPYKRLANCGRVTNKTWSETAFGMRGLLKLPV